MTFQARNLYYLRISEKVIISVYLYLDERHLNWMSDHVLQLVLSDLRPLIVPEICAKIYNKHPLTIKKAGVNIYQGETYQFCFFFRKNEPHSLTLKTRHFVAQSPAAATKPRHPVILSSKQKREKKRKKENLDDLESIKIARKKKSRTQGDDGDSTNSENRKIIASENPPSTRQLRKSTISRRIVPSCTGLVSTKCMTSDDEDFASQSSSCEEMTKIAEKNATKLSNNFHIELSDAEQEEEKPKLALRLKYQGFQIYDYCLCVVVEPWPSIRFISQDSSSRRVKNKKALSDRITACDPTPSISTSAKILPLFLPDPDEGNLPPYHLSDPSSSDDSDITDAGGMFELSQLLCAVGDTRTGAAYDDDDDGDTTMYFGDADEVKE